MARKPGKRKLIQTNILLVWEKKFIGKSIDKRSYKIRLCVLLEQLVAYSVSVSAVNILFAKKNVHEKKKILGSVLGTT